MTKSSNDKTVATNVDPDTLAQFNAIAKPAGISLRAFLRNAVKQFADGTYVSLSALRPETLNVLKEIQQRHHFTTLQPVVEMLVADRLRGSSNA